MNFCEIFNYPIYEVGGCVRDSILGIPIKDIDLASDLKPEDFKALCKKLGYKTHDTGIAHGTVTAIIQGIPYEHTTFRQDVSCDGRNATIEYSKTIQEDLSRRDFTINAIARLGDKIIDPFKGQQDLIDKRLRAVGNAEERFSEDYLRIVRAARFISRLNLKADGDLKQAAKKLSPNIIKHVSIERISDEIRKAQAHGSDFFKEAENLGFLSFIFPETNELSEQEKKNWLEQIEKADNKNELLYLASILIPIYKENAESKAAQLRMSRHISKGIGILFKLKDTLNLNITPAALRDVILESKGYYEDLKEYFTHIHKNTEDSQKAIQKINLIEKQVLESIDKPFITGEYLLKAKLKPSSFFKEVLDECGKLQSEGNSAEEVKALANEKIRNHKL